MRPDAGADRFRQERQSSCRSCSLLIVTFGPELRSYLESSRGMPGIRPLRRATEHRRLIDMRETALYPTVKRFLEQLGFQVKGEVNGCDIVAVRDGEPPRLVIVEMKLGFNLDLLLQLNPFVDMTRG
jgi:hypothetical protein